MFARIIGEVVCTQSHCWISLDDVLASNCKSETPFNVSIFLRQLVLKPSRTADYGHKFSNEN